VQKPLNTLTSMKIRFPSNYYYFIIKQET